MDKPRLAEHIFFGFIHPDRHPSLLLDDHINWRDDTSKLPKRFLIPLSGPDGETIGCIEFAYHTTPGRLGRWASVKLHNEPLSLIDPNLPVLRVVTPISGPNHGIPIRRLSDTASVLVDPSVKHT